MQPRFPLLEALVACSAFFLIRSKSYGPHAGEQATDSRGVKTAS